MKLLRLSGSKRLPAFDEAQTSVTLNEWRDHPQSHADATALLISNDEPLDGIAADLHAFQTIILSFPDFKDGRAYSQARQLREQFHYTGEIRARGDFLPDQIGFLARCGFTSFEFSGAEAEATAGLNAFSFVYQAAADGAAPVWRLRGARAAAA